MINFLRGLVFKYFYIQVLASYIYMLLGFLENKNKIKIYFRNNFWIHETFLGKFATTHPIRKSEKYLMQELPFFIKYFNCKEGDVIFDAGAGIGTEIIFFSKLVGEKGKVFALEANPNVYNHLVKTIELNQIKNVIPINLAVFSVSGQKLRFSSEMSDWLGGKINDKGNIFVNTITFDDLIRKYDIQKINFAKFNIEGAEKYLLTGDQNFIKKCENVCISCHDFLEDNSSNTYEKISQLISKNNFYFLEGNENLKNIKKDKKYYIYGTKEQKYFNMGKKNYFEDHYKFYSNLLKT